MFSDKKSYLGDLAQPKEMCQWHLFIHHFSYLISFHVQISDALVKELRQHDTRDALEPTNEV